MRYLRTSTSESRQEKSVASQILTAIVSGPNFECEVKKCNNFLVCAHILEKSQRFSSNGQDRPFMGSPTHNRITDIVLILAYLLCSCLPFAFSQTGTLVVGGHFTTVSHLYNLLSWENGDWMEIGGGLQSTTNYNEIFCLDECKYGLVIGGDFRLSGMQNIALFNGTNFWPWGRVDGDAVIAIAVDKESDIIFIAKQMSGGLLPVPISMWSFRDMKWSDLPGAFLTGKDVSLLVDQQFLYVAGIVTFQNNNSKTVCTKTSVFRRSNYTWKCIDYEANGFYKWNDTVVAYGNPRNGFPIVTITEEGIKPLGNLSELTDDVAAVTSDGVELYAAVGPFVFVLNNRTLQWQPVGSSSTNFVDSITWIGFLQGKLYTYSNHRMFYWDGVNWIDMSHMFWTVTGKINVLFVASKNYGSINFRVPTGGIVALIAGGAAVLAAALLTFFCLKRKPSPYERLV